MRTRSQVDSAGRIAPAMLSSISRREHMADILQQIFDFVTGLLDFGSLS